MKLHDQILSLAPKVLFSGHFNGLDIKINEFELASVCEDTHQIKYLCTDGTSLVFETLKDVIDDLIKRTYFINKNQLFEAYYP